MALYIPHSIFRLARLLYVRPETFGPYYVCLYRLSTVEMYLGCLVWTICSDSNDIISQ